MMKNEACFASYESICFKLLTCYDICCSCIYVVAVLQVAWEARRTTDYFCIEYTNRSMMQVMYILASREELV